MSVCGMYKPHSLFRPGCCLKENTKAKQKQRNHLKVFLLNLTSPNKYGFLFLK